MTKLNFLLTLHEKLSGLPLDEVEERLGFYSEMIEDRMEEGIPEEDAVAAVGDIDAVAAQIAAELSGIKTGEAAVENAGKPVLSGRPDEEDPVAEISNAEKAAPQSRKSVWPGILLALGSPLWAALILAFFAMVLAACITLWAVLVSLWAVFVSLAAAAAAGAAVGVLFLLGSNRFAGLALAGAALVCAGLAVFAFYGCRAATAGTLWLTKKTARGMKNLFCKKEGTQ